MKNKKRLIAILSAIILVVSFTIPALAAESGDNGIEFVKSTTGGKYNQSFETYFNSQGDTVEIASGITAVPKNDDGQGLLWTIYADDTVAAGTTITIYVQTQGNNWVSYELKINGEGSFEFKQADSNGRGFAIGIKDPDPTDPTDPTEPTEPTEPTPCTCTLKYDISKAAFLDEACTEPATIISDNTIVWYAVTVTVAIVSSNCKAAEGEHTMTLPPTVTIKDRCMSGGETIAEVTPNEDGTAGTATVVYSYKVLPKDFVQRAFTNTATVNDQSAHATVTRQTGHFIPETPVVTITEEPQVALVETPDEVENFEEVVPLTEAPVVEEIAEIEEPAPPLSQMPQTGISDSIILMICGLLAASAILPVAVITLKKVKKNDVNK